METPSKKLQKLANGWGFFNSQMTYQWLIEILFKTTNAENVGELGAKVVIILEEVYDAKHDAVLNTFAYGGLIEVFKEWSLKMGYIVRPIYVHGAYKVNLHQLHEDFLVYVGIFKTETESWYKSIKKLFDLIDTALRTVK